MPIYLGFNLDDLLEKERFVLKLPLRKRRFVEAFTTTLSIDKTCKLLGISVRRGYNLFRDEDVQRAISYLQDLASFRNTITQDYFINKLKEIIEDKDTKQADKISALTLLARVTGHIREKSETNAQVVVLKNQGLVIDSDEE